MIFNKRKDENPKGAPFSSFRVKRKFIFFFEETQKMSRREVPSPSAPAILQKISNYDIMKVITYLIVGRELLPLLPQKGKND